MKRLTKVVLAACLMTAAPAAWSQSAEEEALARQREAEALEAERNRAEVERRAEDIEREMREAERQLAEAAQRIAELSGQRLPMVGEGNWAMKMAGRPMLGITIGESDDDTPVEGVKVMGVTPGGAAAEAGLRAGDVITGVNGEDLGASSPLAANRKLLEFMEGVEEGDTVMVDYERDGETGRVGVEPRAVSPQTFAFGSMPGKEFHFVGPPGAPTPPGDFNHFVFRSGNGWGDLELVALTEGLGRYFGTDEGLLVVRAPGGDALELMDGDVILRIGGREPQSVSHAIRILGSYQAGERLEIEIMRDRKRRTLEVEMPDSRSSAIPGLGGPRFETEVLVVPPVPDAPRAPEPADAERS